MMAERGDLRRRQLRICALGERPRRQGGQPDLRAGAAQGAARALGRALPGADRRRARRCWKRNAPRSRRRIGSATRIGHADIMVACALRFTGEAHPALFDAALSGAAGPRRALRGAAAVPGDFAAARSAEGVNSPAHICSRGRSSACALSCSSSGESAHGCPAMLSGSFLGFDRLAARGLTGNFATGSSSTWAVKPS